jgi:long-chain acyl-CoA synthetase
MSASTELPTPTGTGESAVTQEAGAARPVGALGSDEPNAGHSVISHGQTAVYPEPVGVSLEMTLRTRAAQSIPDLFVGLAEKQPKSIALVDDHHRGGQLRLTYSELKDRIAVFAAGLKHLGLQEGQFVGLFSENSARWLIADQGIMSVGAAAAVRGVDAPVDELTYIYEHSGSAALVAEDSTVLSKLLAGGLDPSGATFIVLLYGSLPSDSHLTNVYSFDDVMAKGQSDFPGQWTKPDITRSSIATVLYTSGTTGRPKGVALTHGNILAQLDRISIGPLDPLPGEVFVSVLPCWHIFERTAAYYCLTKGMQVVYSNKRHFRDDLLKHRPHVLIAVPRVFENLFASVMSKLRNARSSQKAVFSLFAAISVAFIHARRSVQGLSLSAPLSSQSLPQKVLLFLKFLVLAPLYALANLLVWKKIRAALGNRVKLCVCGGGSVPEYIEDFFEAASVDICIGYGLTETSPVICNRFAGHNVRGSAGLPLPDTEVRVVDLETRQPLPDGQQGELLVKGPQVFSGYFKDSEATSKAFDSLGYFDTGDLAYVGPDGDVVITGRSKDVIVLSNGENIEPAPIEDAIVGSALIDQVMLVGQDEKHLGALVVPSLPALLSAGLIDEAAHARLEMLLRSNESEELRKESHVLLNTPGVYEALNSAITQANRSRSTYTAGDRIHDLRLILEPFSVENGMLTQTLKVKRNVVSDVYSSDILGLCRK